MAKRTQPINNNGDDDKNGANKIKLLKLYNYLYHNTDKNRRKSTTDLLEFLQSCGISCDRRTLAKDIEVLNRYGYEVQIGKSNKGNTYYIDETERTFEESEIFTILDALQAARFINERVTARLSKRLVNLLGVSASEAWQQHHIVFNTRKVDILGNIFEIISQLNKAINDGHKVTFKYFDLDKNNKKIYRHEGHIYELEPIAVVYLEDCYYLIGFDVDENMRKNFRIDRIDKIDEGSRQHRTVEKCEDMHRAISPPAFGEEDMVRPECSEWRREINSYVSKSFHMFSGENEITLTLLIPKDNLSLLGAVRDKFDLKELREYSQDSQKWQLMVTVHDSPTFWGWLTFFEGQIGIKEDKMRQKFEAFLQRTCARVRGDLAGI